MAETIFIVRGDVQFRFDDESDDVTIECLNSADIGTKFQVSKASLVAAAELVKFSWEME